VSVILVGTNTPEAPPAQPAAAEAPAAQD